MKELSTIIEARDKKFKEGTIEIFLAIDLSIECVEAFLSGVEPMFAAGSFSWNDVFHEDGLITILGVVSFEDGMTIETDEGTINITKDNLEYFQRVVRMALPYDLVANGERDAIMVFLEKLHKSGKGQDFEEINQNAPHVQTAADFDLSELTNDQQAALKMYNINKQTNN